MGTVPVLKPKEVAAILEKLGFQASGKKAPINSIAIQTDEELPSHSTPEGISRLYC